MTTADLTDTPVELDPFAHQFHDNPFPVYQRLRDEAPVYVNQEMGFYALSRFADVFDAFRDWATYSSAKGVALESMAMEGSGSQDLIESDPPQHTRLRKMVSRMFTSRRIATIEDQVRQVVRRWLDDLPTEPGARFDLISEFTGPFPMDVISEILGVPQEDRDHLRHQADLMVAREEGTLEIPEHTMRAFVEITGYFRKHLDWWRSGDRPGLIAEFFEMQRSGDDPPTDEEIIGFAFLFIIAGHETTTKMVANAIDVLDRHPDQRAELVADPSLIPGAVEEVMRFNNSTHYMARWLTRDVTLHGVTMKAGTPVLLLIGAANRDEREFTDPDRFDIHRRLERSLAFGHGAHFCLGAHLARLEGRVALEEFLARYPTYTAHRDGAERIHAGNVMGWSSFPLTV